MKLAILGGGGFRVPLVHGALLDDALGAGAGGDQVIDRVVLHDVDPGALRAIAAVLEQRTIAASGGRRANLTVETTTDLDAAIAGSDFVFSAIRVGGLAGRVLDERVALGLGLLGQETVGAGGISYALRTLPAATHIAERVAALAPGAWLINFTNPAGTVTEACLPVLGERVVGICDSAVGAARRALRALEVDAATPGLRVDYAGLNHLGWLNGLSVPARTTTPFPPSDSRSGDADPGYARDDAAPVVPGAPAGGTEDLLARLLADPARLESFEEGRLFGAGWLRALGSIPNEYLDYYYRPAETLRAIAAAPETRGEALLRDIGAFYRDAAAEPGRAAELWERAHAGREASYMAENRSAADAGPRAAEDLQGGGYEGVALSVMRALAGASAGAGQAAGEEPILNVRNGGAIAGLDADAVVEVPCVVDPGGARPSRPQDLSLHQLSLVSAVKACEREVIDAVRARSADAALRAFAYHPLVASAPLAARLLSGYRRAFPALDALFG